MDSRERRKSSRSPTRLLLSPRRSPPLGALFIRGTSPETGHLFCTCLAHTPTTKRVAFPNSSTGPEFIAVVRRQEIQPVCDLRATAIAARIWYGSDYCLTTSTYDDGARGEPRQTVLAETFRMVCAARQHGALRIPNSAFLIALRP